MKTNPFQFHFNYLRFPTFLSNWQYSPLLFPISNLPQSANPKFRKPCWSWRQYQAHTHSRNTDPEFPRTSGSTKFNLTKIPPNAKVHYHWHRYTVRNKVQHIACILFWSYAAIKLNYGYLKEVCLLWISHHNHSVNLWLQFDLFAFFVVHKPFADSCSALTIL